jgi:alkylhydroperoxidase/carboxymuconolactone decarboxylase family protein YurZ
MASQYTEQNGDKVKEAHSTLYDAGLEMRNKVAGKEYVDRALANATSDFARPMQEVNSPPNSITTEAYQRTKTASNRSGMGKHLDTTWSRSQD